MICLRGSDESRGDFAYSILAEAERFPYAASSVMPTCKRTPTSGALEKAMEQILRLVIGKRTGFRAGVTAQCSDGEAMRSGKTPIPTAQHPMQVMGSYLNKP